MKVLITTNVPSPYRVDFFNELGKYCDLTVTFQKRTSSERDKSWENYKFDNFNAVFLKGVSIRVDQAFCFGYKKLLKNNYDVILSMDCGTPSGAIFANYLAKKGIPFYIETDGCFYSEPKTFKQKLKFKIKKKFYGKAAGCFVTCLNSRRTCLSLGVDEGKIINYPFTSLFEKDLLTSPITDGEKEMYKKELNLSGDKIVLAVGQFIKRKGFDVLIKAAKILGGGVKVCFVGGVPTQEYIELVKSLNLNNIEFVGFTQKEELKKYYRAADVFVLPTREDIWGLVINEAMANALPVITTDMCVSGQELIKDGENGYIVPVGDDGCLTEKLNEILLDDDKRRAFGAKSIEKIRPTTIEIKAKVHLSAWESGINGENIKK